VLGARIYVLRQIFVYYYNMYAKQNVFENRLLRRIFVQRKKN